MKANVFDINGFPGFAELRAETAGEPEILIAVLDGFADLSHPCFRKANVSVSGNFCTGLAPAGAAAEHGTSVSSIIFGQPGSTINGIAPFCRGILIPLLRENKEQKVTCTQLDLALAIDEAVEKGANIINISGGEFSPSGKADKILADTIERHSEKGVIIIASAGNEGCRCLHVPAGEQSVVAAGALDLNMKPMELSNWGDIYKQNGLLFPGENIPAAIPGGDIALKSGTSFSAAVASGIAALLLSIYCKHGKKPDGKAVVKAMFGSALPCTEEGENDCRRILAGIINIPGAYREILQEIKEPDPATVKYAGIKTENKHNNLIKGEKKVSDLISQEAEASIKAAPTGVKPSDCGCGCGGSGKKEPQGPQQVYAIGTLGYDFQSESVRDSFQQLINGSPEDPAFLLSYLDENPEASENVIWTLNIESTPVYAILPTGGFAAAGYFKIREYMRGQLEGEVQRVSVPGVVAGKVRLMLGYEIPAIIPNSYGMYSWTTTALLETVAGKAPVEQAKLKDYEMKKDGLHNFLTRIYYELSNLGITSQDRAINYAATNAFQIEKVFMQAVNEEMELDTISVEKSPVCKPGADCWDVKLIFFNPKKRIEQSRKVYRFTVDVSNVIPVTVGDIRSWNIF